MKKVSYLLIITLLAAVAGIVLPTVTAPITSSAAMKHTVDFETGDTMGFEKRGDRDTSILTVTDEMAYEGDHSLLVTGRTLSWNGPSFNVTDYVVPGEQYTISVWIHVKSPDSSNFRLSRQAGQGVPATYHNIVIKLISIDDGWVELTGTHVFPDDDYLTIYIENDTANAEFYIDNFSFSQAEDAKFNIDLDLPSLAETYKDFFLIGSAFSRSDLVGQRFELIKHHFNVMTAGNDMKPDALGGRQRGAYNFARADEMHDILDGAGIATHGHTLVWHQQSADWLNKNADGSYLTREKARENMEEFISEVAAHYAGRVISWDVVNEAFQTSIGSAPADWKDALRKGGTSNESSAWFGAYANGANEALGESGADYIYDAFVFTRLADPNAILYYNDFNETERGKREAIAMMTEDLNELWKTDPRNTEPDRLLIEGLGMQAHYWTDSLKAEDVEDTILRWKATGVEISITELDIPMGNWNGYRASTPELEATQATLYAQLMMVFKRHAESITRVTFWGLDDATSWRSEGNPLLFYANGTAKPAFFAIADPEGFLGLPPIDPPPPPDTPAPPIEPVEPGVPEEPGPGDEEAPSASNRHWLIIVLSIVPVAVLLFVTKHFYFKLWAKK